MSNTKHQTLDAGFVHLSRLVADLGESFTPARHDVYELADDTRATLDEARYTQRQRMSA